MRVVTLVPWRPGELFRERHWRYVEPHLASVGFPVITGDAPGVWARAAACNAASEAAGAWDVALVTDADTILDADTVHEAVRVVAESEGAARPHDQRFMLSLGASKMAMMRGVESLPDRYLRWTAPGGGALVIHRKAWDAVGGYDERFIGWGYEDSAMNISLVSRADWRIVPGPSWHLFHAPANIRDPAARRNLTLLQRHRQQNIGHIRKASRRAGFDLNRVL